MRACILLMSLAALAGCNKAAPGIHEPERYEGCATDENWRTFDEQELGRLVKTDDTQATLFAPPLVDGASLPLASKPTFTWQPSMSVTGKMNGDASCPKNCTLCARIPPDCNLCGQHLAATSGDTYDLQFSVGGTVAYRLVTTLQYFTPAEALWTSWKGQTVSLQAVRILFKVNDVQEGPFAASKPLTFTVGN